MMKSVKARLQSNIKVGVWSFGVDMIEAMTRRFKMLAIVAKITLKVHNAIVTLGDTARSKVKMYWGVKAQVKVSLSSADELLMSAMAKQLLKALPVPIWKISRKTRVNRSKTSE